MEKEGLPRVVEVPEVDYLMNIAHPPYSFDKTIHHARREPLFIVSVSLPIVYSQSQQASDTLRGQLASPSPSSTRTPRQLQISPCSPWILYKVLEVKTGCTKGIASSSRFLPFM